MYTYLLTSFNKIANTFYNFLIAAFFEEYSLIKSPVRFNVSRIERRYFNCFLYQQLITI